LRINIDRSDYSNHHGHTPRVLTCSNPAYNPGMELMLLLGSGTSYASGLPSVDKITDATLNGQWFQHTTEIFFPGHPPAARPADPTQVVQEFLKHLKPWANRSHPLSGRPGNYEDLFFLAEQIAEDACGQVDNPALQPFVQLLQEQTKDLTERLHISLGKLAGLACDFIRCAVHSKLASHGVIQGLNLLESLARSDEIQRLDIVTLNHDLLIERFLAESGIPFIDGFGDPDGDVRFFEPSRFESASKVRLLKLHGSINWYRFRPPGQDEFSDRFAMPVGASPDHAKNGQGQLLSNLDVIPWFLAGTHRKANQYGFGIYGEMHFRFHRLLNEHSTIAMSGYGWGDRGINGRLMEWLHAPRDRRLILMAEDVDNLVSFSSSALWHRYKPLVEAGRIAPVRKWMQDLTMDEVMHNLTPLKVQHDHDS
jgi:hypothetical protein